MTHTIKKKDIRTIKTQKALNKAMSTLLKQQNFGKITVTDLCKEAQISRATFYANFDDKYDLLKYWLKIAKMELANKSDNSNILLESYDKIEKSINQFMSSNRKIVKNVLEDANGETLELLFEWIISFLDISSPRSGQNKVSAKHAVLANFYAGGMVYYHLWQAKNKFPPNVPAMNIYLYEIMKKFREWLS